MSDRILVVDDEPSIQRTLRINLRARGYDVETVGCGRDALAVLAEAPPDLVILDLGLPDLDGVEVLRRLRTRSTIPVIVLSARHQSDDKVEALDEGADDYVTKPFSPQEVVLRVAAVLSRSNPQTVDDVMSYGHGVLVIDEARHEARLDGQLLDLTPSEWGILVALAATPGRVSTRAELVNRVRGYEFAGYERTIDSHVKNLRRKLAGHGTEIVETVLGVGYRLGLRRD